MAALLSHNIPNTRLSDNRNPETWEEKDGQPCTTLHCRIMQKTMNDARGDAASAEKIQGTEVSKYEPERLALLTTLCCFTHLFVPNGVHFSARPIPEEFISE